MRRVQRGFPGQRPTDSMEVSMVDVISNFAARYERTREEVLSLQEYLEICKREPLAYATAAERMLKAIGEPELVDTRNDPRLSRIFANKVIKIYPAFREFYAMAPRAWKKRSRSSTCWARSAAARARSPSA